MLERLWNYVLREPTATAELVRQVLLWSLAMGFLHLTEAQSTQTMSVVSAILFFINRALVSPSRG